MESIRVGQRVRVINRGLVHSRQVGTVIGVGAEGGFYVHLDYDDDQPDARIFFHAEELELAARETAETGQLRGDADAFDSQARH